MPTAAAKPTTTIAQQYAAAKEYATEQIAEFLGMLYGWTATRLAWAGNGSGTVSVPEDDRYIYARLDGETGPLIEAQLINLFVPANNDFIAVRREKPGGLGGWLVIDIYGATAPTIRPCAGGGFFVNFDRLSLFGVTSLSVGGGVGATVYTEANDVNYWVAASLTTVVWVFHSGVSGSSGTWVIAYSTDGGVTFTDAYELTNDFVAYVNFWRFLHVDYSTSSLMWGALNLGTTGSQQDEFVVSQDSGVTWTQHNVNSFPAPTWEQTTALTMPRHNGSDMIMYHGHKRLVPVGQWRGWFNQYIVGTGFWDAKQITEAAVDFATKGDFVRGVCRYGVPDELFVITETTGDVYKLVWSTLTLSSLSYTVAGHKQIVTTLLGTILIIASGSGPFLKVHRSTDGGASWTEIDLSSMIPASPANRINYWDYIAVDTNNTLFIPLEDGTGIFSSDDGATWSQTGDFMTHSQVFDVAGVI